MRARLLVLLAVAILATLFTGRAYAECGGHIQCIGVGATASDAQTAGIGHHPAPDIFSISGAVVFTLAFGNQATGSTSASQTIYVAAVTGPVGATTTLGPITLTGTDPASFSITGGTCLTSNPIQGGAACTITVAFNPATVGAKSARVDIPLNPLAGPGLISGRSVGLTGTATLGAPVITSALAASGAAGVAFAGYTITATNSPTSFGATGLPPGLSLNTSTGVISGTPNTNGTFNTTITATNATATDTKTLVFTISLLAPVITSAATASGATGQAFTYQITATNNPTSFTASPLPPGLSVNTSTGIISGTPTASGTTNVTLAATNATGTASQVVAVTIGAVPPTAQAGTINVPLNTPLTFTPTTTGPFISLAITLQPAHGTATASGTQITYTPATDYFGADSFSYRATNVDGTSAPAVITVQVGGTGLGGRPDPTKSPTISPPLIGVVTSQAAAAGSFSRAQILNFQRRMDGLHRSARVEPSAAVGATALGPGRTSGPNPVPSMAVTGVTVASADSGVGSVRGAFDLAGGTERDSRAGLRGTRESGRPGEGLGGSPSPVPTSWIRGLLSAAETRTLNLSQSDRSESSSFLPEGTGMWIGGNLRFGTRDATATTGSSRFSTDGVSAGIDRQFSDKLTLGLGLGYARDTTDIGTDGTQTRSRGTSVAAYGSYALGARGFVDGLIGYGVLDIESRRFVPTVNDYARASRDGEQLFGSLAAGFEHVRDSLLLSPYGRLDFAFIRLDQAFETGAGANALAYLDQKLETVQFSLGLRAEAKHATSFGWALPRLRAELRHDFTGDRAATVAYVDQFAGPRYSVTSPGLKRDALVLGIGSDLVLRNGMKLSFDYQVDRAFGGESAHALRLWLATDLDGRGSLPGLTPSTLFANPVRVEAAYAWDDNINRERSFKLSDHIYSLSVTKSWAIPVTSHSRLLASGFLGGDKLHTYTGLDRFSGGANAEFQYRTSGDFDAVTFGVFGRALFDEYNSDLRTGYRYAMGVNARQSLTDRIDLFGALSGNWRRADNVVFDARDYSARFNLDYALIGGGTPYLSGEYRRGDTVSTGPRSVDNLAIAKAFVRDDAYWNNQLFAYRYDARTVLWTVGYNWPLGPRDAIDFSLRHVRSSPTDTPNYALAGGYGVGGPALGVPTYTANQYSLVYLMRF